MAKLQTFHLSHLPPELAVHVALYQGLQNATFLRQQLLDGNPAFEYALIDAGVVRLLRFLDLSLVQAKASMLMCIDSVNHPRPSSRLPSR